MFMKTKQYSIMTKYTEIKLAIVSCMKRKNSNNPIVEEEDESRSFILGWLKTNFNVKMTQNFILHFS